MLNQTKGSINSKKNRRLRNLLIKKSKKQKEIILEEKKIEKEKVDKKKKELELSQSLRIKRKEDVLIEERIEKKKEKTTSPLPNSNQKTTTYHNLDIESENKKMDKENKPPIHKVNLKPVETPNQELAPVQLEEKVKTTNPGKEKEEKILVSPTLKPTEENTQSDSVNTQEKNLLELAVTNEIEVILKEKQYDLNQLIVDFNTINQHVDEIVETEELETMSKEIDDLIKKLEIIKRELELLTNSATFKNIYQLHNPYLTNMIDEYRETLHQNKEMLDTVIKVENTTLYTSIIDKIVEFETEKDKLTKELEGTKEKYKIRDDDFEKWKNDYIDLEKIEKSLDEITETSHRKLQEIEKKVSQSVTVTEIVETKMKSSLSILAKTMLLVSLFKRNPTRQANAITAVSTITAFSLINDFIKPKKITTKRIETDLVDYKHMISDTIHDVEKIDILISHSLEDIKELRTTFQNEFEQYQYDLPEYKEFFDKLSRIESEMLDRKHHMNQISHELNYQYDKNNEKVKKYQNIIP